MAAKLASRVFRSCALILFGVALALVVGEAAARLTWTTTVQAPYTPPDPYLPAITNGVLGLARPHAEGIYRNVYYRSNSYGFRGREYSPEAPAGVFRIAIAGDSFTMGDGVVEEKAYPRVLETKLNRLGIGDFEVLNFGLAGSNVHHVAQRLRRLAPVFDPDLIVYGFTANDIEGPYYRKTTSLDTQLEQQLRYLRFAGSRSYLLRVLWPRYQAFRELVRPVRGTYVYELLENYYANEEAWRSFEDGLDQIVAIGRERGTPVVVLVHTLLVYLNRFHPLQPIYAKVEGAAEQRGSTVIPSLPAHYGKRPEDLWVSEIDSHPNDLGHEILANVMADWIQAHLDDLRAPRSG
jgi:hypothetical protein